MAIQITGKNIDVGGAFQSYVSERIDQVIGKYVDGEIAGHVRVQKERNFFRTDCSITLRSGLILQSHGESTDAYASADAAIEKLEKRLRRYRRRLKNHHAHHTSQSVREEGALTAADYVVEASDADEAGAADGAPVIIAETQRAIRELPVSDAVMEMDLADQPFLVFRNAGHGEINIVYRREDGNIGWIDPAVTRAGRDED